MAMVITIFGVKASVPPLFFYSTGVGGARYSTNKRALLKYMPKPLACLPVFTLY